MTVTLSRQVFISVSYVVGQRNVVSWVELDDEELRWALQVLMNLCSTNLITSFTLDKLNFLSQKAVSGPCQKLRRRNQVSAQFSLLPFDYL